MAAGPSYIILSDSDEEEEFVPRGNTTNMNLLQKTLSKSIITKKISYCRSMH
jgi:hypothetical protein